MKIAVYCGSSNGSDPSLEEAARRLGDWIASCGHTLVYGGGNSGLMGVVAQAVHDAGQKVIGVLPGDVPIIMERPQPYATELVVAKNMSERKQVMLELADAYIALPGGIGTLDEITEAITLIKLGMYQKKCIFFNVNDFYEPVKEMFDRMYDVHFMEREHLEFVLFSADTDEIGLFLNKKNGEER